MSVISVVALNFPVERPIPMFGSRSVLEVLTETYLNLGHYYSRDNDPTEELGITLPR